MCSRWRISPGASEHITSIASWSPRKSEPLTVSYACERQSSSTLIAALMPPAAATECERTGWTLLMIATLAPCCAAARAARCPARPAPMIKTSCAGMAPCASSWGEAAARLYNERASVPGSSGGRQGAADLGEGDHALQHPVGVDGDHRAEPAEALRAEHRFERRLFADPQGQVLLEVVHHLESRAPGGDLRLDAL